MSKWINVKDKMPDGRSEVLVFCKFDTSPLIAFHDNNTWIEKCDNLDIVSGDARISREIHEVGAVDIGYEITHWMPLPEPPK